MTKKKYALKFLKNMTDEDKNLLKEKTKDLVLPQNLKTEEEVLYKKLIHFLKKQKNELKKQEKGVIIIDFLDLKDIEKYTEQENVCLVASFPETLVLVPKKHKFFKQIKG